MVGGRKRTTRRFRRGAADTRLDLLERRVPGFEEAREVVAGHLRTWDELMAVQAARGAFGAEGFEAAAITAMGATRGAAMIEPQRTVIRRADLRFDRPYAVVAVALERDGAAVEWHGVPVYSVWITEPSEPVEPARGRSRWTTKTASTPATTSSAERNR